MTTKIMPLLFILLTFSTGYGFLLEKHTTGGTALTDQHYIYLLGLLTEEKSNSQQMEQLILKLNNEVKLLQKVQGNGSSQEITELKNGYSALQKELIQVKNDNFALAKNVEMLRSEIYICNNETMKLKTELEIFTHSISAGKLKNITQMQSSVESLEHKMDTTTTQLNMLASSSNARSQDFLALLNQTRDAQHKITILDTESRQRLQSYQNSTNQTITALETQTKKNMQDYKNSTIQKVTTLETDFNGYKGSTNQKINDAFQRLTAINQTVVLTSCSDGETVSSSSVVKFSQTKTVNGISDVNTFKNSGKFTCEVPGIYLFSVFIMSESNPSDYIMYKTNSIVSFVYIVNGSNNGGSNYHTGTGILAVSLNVGDTLYVKASSDMVVYSGYSCMTVIKIR